jgi:hypothetical protein
MYDLLFRVDLHQISYHTSPRISKKYSIKKLHNFGKDQPKRLLSFEQSYIISDFGFMGKIFRGIS